jgi:WD40 repeat protein
MWYIAFSSDNLKIVSGCDIYCIKIRNADTGQLLNTLVDHTKWISGVAFSSDNLKIVSGSYDCPAELTRSLWG